MNAKKKKNTTTTVYERNRTEKKYDDDDDDEKDWKIVRGKANNIFIIISSTLTIIWTEHRTPNTNRRTKSSG